MKSAKLPDLDLMCIGMGNICVHCHEKLPATEDAPRRCPEVGEVTG